jgi:hypothetical protein
MLPDVRPVDIQERKERGMRWIFGALVFGSALLMAAFALDGRWMLAASEAFTAAIWCLIFMTWEPRP